jgi:hypothetical protein
VTKERGAAMATFEIRRREEVKARIFIQDDAAKTWEFSSEWDRDWYFGGDVKMTIEQALDSLRLALIEKKMNISGFTITQTEP